MKFYLVVHTILAGFFGLILNYAVKNKGELDLPSFVMARASHLVLPDVFPRRDLSDLYLWRVVLAAFQAPNNMFYGESTIYSTDVELGFFTYFTKVPYAPISVRVYRTKIEEGPPKDVIVWFHGGGFVLGGVEPDDAICSELAVEANAVVVSVEYRLAPEHPFPVPVEDSISAMKWVSKHISDYGGNPRKIFVSGESAGGNIAAAVTSHNLDTSVVAVEDRVSIIGAVLVYPAVDIGVETESYDLYGGVNRMLSTQQARHFAELYCNNTVTTCNGDYLFSPLKTPDAVFAEYPPTVVVLAKHDLLLDEGLRFVDKLRRFSKNTVDLKVYESTIHFFFGKHLFTHGKAALSRVARQIVEISKAVGSV
jgi:acetyl esterase